MKPQLAGAVVLVSLVTTACAGPGAAGRTPTSSEVASDSTEKALSATEARETLRAADATMAETMSRKGSAEGIASAATGDALLLLDEHYTLRGAEAIRARLTAEPLERDGAIGAEALVWDVSADGRMGYTVGQVLLDSTGGTAGASGASPALKPGKRYQRYLAVWTRTPDGPWRLAAAVYGRARGPLSVPPSFSVTSVSAAPAMPASPSDVLAEAFAADSAFSEQSTREGMGKAFIDWAAPNAIIPGGPSGFFGREAIVRNYAPLTRDKVELRWEPRLGGGASSGDMAYTVGRAVSVSPGPDGNPDTRYVKYLSVWRRQPDGQWRYVADSGNGNPGPDGP
ncbi:DUF4440 domain-containing protein [Archangium lipolyticum]|uniref:DUF4440 domain-containing protein n=1 Tax=Archangium lipolyticum TaxID=2970465 RepID=UPI002149AC15|nr:DUF4440 domain-containing protein [Archangium lipolyticum]